MQRPSDEKDDVVNHVAVGNVVQESGQRSCGLSPHVLEFCDQLILEFVVDERHL